MKFIIGTIGTIIALLCVYIAICIIAWDIIYINTILLRVSVILSIISGITFAYSEDTDKD